MFYKEKKIYKTLTSEVSLSLINNLNNFIFPSIVQKRIEKRYELRIFYLDEKLSTQAFFTNKIDNNDLDYRNYSNKNSFRTSNFKLPKYISKKILKLLTNLKIDSCSLDFIVNDKLEFYFLEINPIGQFGSISLQNNLNIEKKIAEYLCRN